MKTDLILPYISRPISLSARVMMCFFLVIAHHLIAYGLGPEFTAVPNAGSLSFSTPNTIYQDSRGMVWFGTLKEAIVFDGVRARQIALTDDKGLPLPINAICESADKQSMLIGSTCGLYSLSTSDYDSKPVLLFGNEIERVNCLKRTAKGNMLIGTNRGLKIANPALSSLKTVTIDDCSTNDDSGSKANNVKTLAFRENMVYIGTNEGIYVYDHLQDTLGMILPQKYSKIDVASLLIDDHDLYIGTVADGLIKSDFTGKDVEHIEAGGNVIRALAKDSEGNIFIGSDGDGILVFDSKSKHDPKPYIHRHREANILHNNQIYSLLIDKSDRIFVGYYLMGASYSVLATDLLTIFRSQTIDTYGLSVRNIMSTSEFLFIGTRDGVRIIYKETDEVVRLSKPQLRSALVISSGSKGDVVYIGTFGGGLSAYNVKTKEFIPNPFRNAKEIDPTVFDSGSIFSITADQHGSIWFATSDGLYCLSSKGELEVVKGSRNNGTLENIYEVFFDSIGRGWVCTNLGIYLVSSDNELSQEELPESFIRNEDVRQVYEDKGNSLFFVGQNGKIWVYQASLELSPLTERLQHIENSRGITEDGRGHLWITTSNGLYRYTPSERRSCHYSFTDGIPSATFNPGMPVMDTEGKLWLGHILGLLVLDTRKSTDSHLANKKAIPTMLEDGDGMHILPLIEKEDGVYDIYLSSWQNNVKIGFSDFSFSNNDVSRFEYLHPQTQTWTPIPADLAFNINNLTSGNTIVKVRQYGSAATESTIILHNPYHINYWLIASMVMIIVLISVIVYLLYHQKSKVSKSAVRKVVPGGESIMQSIDITNEDDLEKDNEDIGISLSDSNVNSNEITTKEKSEAKTYSLNYMTDKECSVLIGRVDGLLRETKLYTNPELKLQELADKLNVSSHKLSYLFNQYVKTGYYEYISVLRVEEFKRLAEADTKQVYTLMALAENAGFNSRTTFFRIFKKHEGVTPGEYLKKLRAE